MTYSLATVDLNRLIYDVGVVLGLESRSFEELTATVESDL